MTVKIFLQAVMILAKRCFWDALTGLWGLKGSTFYTQNERSVRWVIWIAFVAYIMHDVNINRNILNGRALFVYILQCGVTTWRTPSSSSAVTLLTPFHKWVVLRTFQIIAENILNNSRTICTRRFKCCTYITVECEILSYLLILILYKLRKPSKLLVLRSIGFD